jgi:DoxX-like family
MNVALWIGQGLLTLIFLYSGLIKATQTKERITALGQTGVAPFPLPVIRFIATCELLGVVGLIAPWLTGIAPVLTPLAAAALGVLMVLAAIAHLRLKEQRIPVIELSILAICIFVAAGRFADLT